jgi:coenzyme F420-0:L-glutamate ligase / coenzyme F420-1:gamma-L-glutamate ligase
LKNKNVKPLELIPIEGIPDIHPGVALEEIIESAIIAQGDILRQGDIVVITQKIISKAEDRYVHSSSVTPSDAAKKLSTVSQKPPELIELILQESRSVLRYNERAVIVEHKLGFVCANAGIDRSNVQREDRGEGDWYLLLPEDPDKSAANLRAYLEKKYAIKIGVMIIDSHGRAWRYGTVGTAIGISGLPALVDLRGTPDLYGRELVITRVGAADELAGAVSLVMGQAAEKIPAVIARGFPYALRESNIHEVLRSEEMDMFR